MRQQHLLRVDTHRLIRSEPEVCAEPWHAAGARRGGPPVLKANHHLPSAETGDLDQQSEAAHAQFTGSSNVEPHAAIRWAECVLPVIQCPRDVRTIALWGRWVGASTGALRNWCRTARIPARKSLVFARLLRAVVLRGRTGQNLENLLDVVDRRTMLGLLRTAGFCDEDDLPSTIDEFLSRQILVNDSDAVSSVRREFSRLHDSDVANR